MSKIFISHRSLDKEYALRIKDSIEDFGYTVWIDNEKILGGDIIIEKVDQGIAECNFVIALLSKNIDESWVRRELNLAMHYEVESNKKNSNKNCFVIPVLIEECKVPIVLMGKKHINLFEDFDLAIREIIHQIDERNGVKWSYPETPQLAEETLLRSLKKNRNYSSLAIDSGLCFYYSENDNHISNNLIDIKIPEWAQNILSHDLRNPTPEEVRNTIPERFTECRDYLLSRIDDKKVQGFFNCKVGIVKIEKPVKRIGLPLTLTVIPLNYWVIREFNRRILREPQDKQLQAIKNINLELLTKPTNDIDFYCPSALYIEVALLTADGQVCIVEKNPQLSVLAHSSRSKWTATLEEGFEWNKDVDIRNLKINIKSVIERCFHLELDFEDDLINYIRLNGIALEYTHLNTAIFGLCSVSATSGQLVKKIRKSEDFQLQYKFVPVDKIDEDFFLETTDEGKWHPTARLRLHAVKNYITSLRE